MSDEKRPADPAVDPAAALVAGTQTGRRKYARAVGPRLRRLLYAVFGLVALLSANSVYLAGVTFLEWCSRQWGDGLTYQNLFYLSMFLVHLALGLVLVIPFLVFGVLHMLASWNRRNPMSYSA